MTESVISAKRSGPRLELNATALMASTVFTALLGVGFWIVAARLFPANQVGRGSAALSAMTLLAGLAELNVVSMFIRFLPRAGSATTSLIRRGYGLAVGTGVILTAGFLVLGFAHNFLGSGLLAPLAFLAATVAYSVFFVEDGVLIALGAAVWVPLEKLLFGVARVVLVVLLVSVSERNGIFLALTLPVVLAVLVINWYIFGRLVPRHLARADPPIDVSWSQIKGVVAADYVAGAVSKCVALAPPVLVAAILGSNATAYFYTPWFIGVSFGLLLWSVAMSFVVASATHPESLPRLIKRSIRLLAIVSGVGGGITVLAAPLILGTLGSTYAAQGVTALRFIALSVPFTALITLYMAMSLVRKKLKALVIVQVVKAALFMASAALVLNVFGIAGLAATYLALEAAAAVLLLPKTRTTYRLLTGSGP